MGVQESNRVIRYEFREPAGPTELIDLLRLRYRVYRSGRMSRFVPENDQGIDLDSWDIRGRHFGLFQKDAGVSRPLGYMRVVEGRVLAERDDVQRIAALCPELRERLHTPPPTPYPLMSYVPDSEPLSVVVRGLARQGERIGEACRLALTEEARCPRLARFMVESGLAIYYFHHHWKHAMWCCDASKARFYGIYGMRPFTEIRVADFTGIGTSSCVLIGRADDLKGPARRKIERLAADYAVGAATRLDLAVTSTEATGGIDQKAAVAL